MILPVPPWSYLAHYLALACGAFVVAFVVVCAGLVLYAY